MSNIKVLVIEDDKGICDALEFFLEIAGHNALIINSADGALSWLNENKILPPITLVDRRLHDKDGLDLIRTFRRLTNKDSAIYLFSADRISPEEAMSHGATGVIPKPFETSALLKLIEKHVVT